MIRSLQVLVLVLLAACQSSGSTGMVAYASSSGSGDVRTDGATVVVVGDLGADLGVRTMTGLPIFFVPPVQLARDQWYVVSPARNFERRAAITEPLPWWTRELYLPQDLERLAGMGIPIAFESQPVPEPEPPGPLPEP